MAQQWGDKAYSYAKAKEHDGPKEKEDWTQDSDQEERMSEYKTRYEKMKGGLQKLGDLEHVGEEYAFKKGDTLYENVLQGFFKMKQRTAFFVMVRMLEHDINVDSWKPGDTVSINADGALLWTRGEKHGKIDNILEPGAGRAAPPEEEEDDESKPEPADALSDDPAEPPPPPTTEPLKPPREASPPEDGEPPVVEPPQPPARPEPPPPAPPPAPPETPTIPPPARPEAPPPPAPDTREKAHSLDRATERAEDTGGESERPAAERMTNNLSKLKSIADASNLQTLENGKHYLVVDGKKHLVKLTSTPNILYVIVDKTLTPTPTGHSAPGVKIDLTEAATFDQIKAAMKDASRRTTVRAKPEHVNQMD